MSREIESSVQMRLYSLNKRQFVLVFVAFFICFGITVFIGILGPPLIETVAKNATGAPRNSKTGPFRLRSPTMSTFHQQMWLIAHINIDNPAGTHFEQPFNVSVRVTGNAGEDATTGKNLDKQQSDHLRNQSWHNRSRALVCKKECDDLIILHLGYLDYSTFLITIRFMGLRNFSLTFRSIEFHFKSYNPSFTQLEIWIRFIFLVFTFLATCLFAHTLRKFSIRDWSIEQKWISILMPLLVLYDDPLFPLTFLVDSWVPGIIDAVFQATFLCALLLFWLCIYHGVRQTERRFTTFYIPKLVVVGLIWITVITLSSWQEYNELLDPTYYYRLDTNHFVGLKIFFFIVGGLYLLFLLYLLIRAYAELRSMPYFDLRLKFMTVLMLIVLTISATITVLRFGGAILQDNFVAELATRYQNSAEFVSFYGLLNFYMYIMAFVYSPSKNAMYESHFKDNPALSMLNDSDEDVHYGSDVEEVTSTSRNSIHTYESEDE